MTLCERCTKNEEYHTCSGCNQHLCMSCFNMVHFGINAPRAGSSMVYNKCVFCGEIYATNATRVSELIKTNKLDSKLRNENYCKANFGTHASQVIMDAVDSYTRSGANRQILT